MSVWITGANGFIGRHLAKALADTGAIVHGIGHGAMLENERRFHGISEWMEGEIDNLTLCELDCRSSTPKLIYHLAGGASVGASITQPYTDYIRTVATTARLLEWLRISAPDCRLVVASSAAVYGSGHIGSISPQSRLEPVSPYGVHKVLMEHICQSYARTYGLRITVVRLFSVYGPMLRRQLLWDLCVQLEGGSYKLRLGGTGEEIRDWTHVHDVTRLFTMLATQQQQQQNFHVLNGGSGTGVPVKDIARLVASHWSSNVTAEFSGVTREGDPSSLISDSTELRALNFKWGIPISRGIKGYVRWFRTRNR